MFVISAFYMADNNGLQGVLFRYSSKTHIKHIKMRKNQIWMLILCENYI